MKRRNFCYSAAAALFVPAACDSEEGQADGGPRTITIEGSTTVGPLIEDITAMYAAENISFEIVQSGSGDGIDAAGNRRVDIGMASRSLKADEIAAFPSLVPTAIARDAIVVAVHPSNPVSAISKDDLRRVWIGDVTNWSELGGDDAPITLAGRTPESGTRDFFEGFVLEDGGEPAMGIAEYESSTELHDYLGTDPLALAYMGFGFIDEAVKGLAFDDGMPDGFGVVTASVETVQRGEYGFVRGLFLLTHGDTETEVDDFVQFCFGIDAQSATRSAGFVPLF